MSLFLDRSVKNPVTLDQTSTGVSVTTSWQTATIDDDGTSYPIGSYYTAADIPSGAVTAAADNAFTFDPQNAGEYASWQFSFRLSAGFASTDKIRISFPHIFEPYIGKVE